MSAYWKLGIFALGLASTASAQSKLESIIATQEARIKELEAALQADGCGPYGEPVYNSVENPHGSKTIGDRNSHNFWNIPYAQRFTRKGTLTRDLSLNYYNAALYKGGKALYTDLVTDLNGRREIIFQAEADGIDESTMKLINPQFKNGQAFVYDNQFALGWSSPDRDGDPYTANCAVTYGNVTQHYGSCWVYNLGADAETSVPDDDWGPHFHTPTLKAINANLISDGTEYTRVSKITRCVKYR